MRPAAGLRLLRRIGRVDPASLDDYQAAGGYVDYDPAAKRYTLSEEQAFALRAWTRGWDIFQIPGMPIYHQYVSGDTERPLHWSRAGAFPTKWSRGCSLARGALRCS